MNKISIHKDTVSGLLLVGLSIWIVWQSAAFPEQDNGYPGPALFPQVIAFGLGCAGVFIMFKQWRSKVGSSGKNTTLTSTLSGALRLTIGMGLAVSYPILIQYTHFIPLMALLILFVALLLKNAAWHALLMSILSAALIYGLFTQLLSVPL